MLRGHIKVIQMGTPGPGGTTGCQLEVRELHGEGVFELSLVGQISFQGMGVGRGTQVEGTVPAKQSGRACRVCLGNIQNTFDLESRRRVRRSAKGRGWWGEMMEGAKIGQGEGMVGGDDGGSEICQGEGLVRER